MISPQTSWPIESTTTRVLSIGAGPSTPVRCWLKSTASCRAGHSWLRTRTGSRSGTQPLRWSRCARSRSTGTAPAPRRHLMDWAVLLHDLAKKPDGRGRDHVHAFQSAAAAARVLPGLGFAVTEAWQAEAETWYTLVESACRYDAEGAEYVQDNEHLAAIFEGANRLYGADAAVVLKAIALHLAITVVEDWPARTPLAGRGAALYRPIARTCVASDDARRPRRLEHFRCHHARDLPGSNPSSVRAVRLLRRNR